MRCPYVMLLRVLFQKNTLFRVLSGLTNKKPRAESDIRNQSCHDKKPD